MYLNWKQGSLLLHLCSATWVASLPSILASETTPHSFRQNLDISGVKHDAVCSAVNQEEMTLDDLIMSSRGTFSIRSRDSEVESSHITSKLGPSKMKSTCAIPIIYPWILVRKIICNKLSKKIKIMKGVKKRTSFLSGWRQSPTKHNGGPIRSKFWN